MEIRTSCPSRCKYISGGKCIASECPYQTGSVRYDIRMNTSTDTQNYSTQKSETDIIKEYLKQQYDKYVNEYLDIIKRKNIALNDDNCEEIAYNFLIEDSKLHIVIILDLYKNLTGEMLSNEYEDIFGDLLFYGSNGNIKK